METHSTYYTDLIAKYLNGEASPEEIGEIEAWVGEDQANAAIFSDCHKTWKAVVNETTASSTDINYEWDLLMSRIPHPASRILTLSFRIAAIFLLIAIPSFLLYHFPGAPAEKQFAAVSEISQVTLPDGTSVTLNAGSTLTYPAKFEGGFRKVTLQGEGWFEVAHDKTKPFIVAAGNARIRVVGTTFSVNTKTYRNTGEVILSSGIVKVYYAEKPGQTDMLLPGEKAELPADGSAIIKTTNHDLNFLSWKTKHMIFDNTRLNEVVALLSRVYHTNIRLSGNDLSDCRITTTFDNQSLESVLNVLKATLDLQVRDTGAGIEISGKGCSGDR